MRLERQKIRPRTAVNGYLPRKGQSKRNQQPHAKSGLAAVTGAGHEQMEIGFRGGDQQAIGAHA